MKGIRADDFISLFVGRCLRLAGVSIASFGSEPLTCSGSLWLAISLAFPGCPLRH